MNLRQLSRKGKGTPVVSTASLPDIVFMLLFFFMVTTVMRDVELLVTVSEPTAQNVERIENRSLVKTIYIGPPTETKNGTEPMIQLNDDLTRDAATIGPYIRGEIDKMPEPMQPKAITSLKVDREAHMGVITDVKQELRKASALKINYATFEGPEK